MEIQAGGMAMVRHAVWALCLAVFSSCLWGQSGSMNGRILDAASAVVPNAGISVVAVATTQERTASSNDQGLYTIPLLPPGEYKVTVKAAGFKTTTRTVRLEVAQTLTLDLHLEVGELNQSIDVSGQAAVLQSSTSSLGQHIEGKQILDLPLLGRNAYALVQMVPGARMPIQFNDTPVNMFATQFVAVNGARGHQNE